MRLGPHATVTVWDQRLSSEIFFESLTPLPWEASALPPGLLSAALALTLPLSVRTKSNRVDASASQSLRRSRERASRDRGRSTTSGKASVLDFLRSSRGILYRTWRRAAGTPAHTKGRHGTACRGDVKVKSFEGASVPLPPAEGAPASRYQERGNGLCDSARLQR